MNRFKPLWTFKFIVHHPQWYRQLSKFKGFATNAAINPGNSGDPLLNLDGKLISVNAAIASHSGGFEGIGFAIPSNMAVHVASEVIDKGKVVRGWLGVSIHYLPPKQIKSMNLKDSNGALVAEVVKDSPAPHGGLKKDDLVITYRGSKIGDASDFQSRVGDTPVGEKVDLTVLRNNKTIDLTVTIVNLEHAVHKMAASLEDRRGVVVRSLTPEENQRYALTPGNGVTVASLDSGSVLGKAGFEKDDVIPAINNIPEERVQGFVALAKTLPFHQQALLKALDHRTGRGAYVQVTIG